MDTTGLKDGKGAHSHGEGVLTKAKPVLFALYLLQAFLMIPALAVTAGADRMVLVPYPDVAVIEGAQAAVIAWNGTHEYLLLSVNARLSGLTQEAAVAGRARVLAIQIMPFPSIPEVSEGDRYVFHRLGEVLTEHLLEKYRYYPTPLYRGLGGPWHAGEESISLVFFGEIGAHHLAVLEVRDAGQLIDWVKDFYAEKGLYLTGQEDLLKRAEAVVADYVRRGYRYFAVDMIVLAEEDKTIEPLAYTFECDYVYYPLYISSTSGGETDVKLFVLADAWLSKSQVAAAGLEVALRDELSNAELMRISPVIREFMGGGPVRITVLTYSGPAEELKADLEAKPRLTACGFWSLGQISMTAVLGSSMALLAILAAGLAWGGGKQELRREFKLACLASCLALVLSLLYMPMVLPVVRPPYTPRDAGLVPLLGFFYALVLSSSACLFIALRAPGKRGQAGVLIMLLIVLSSVIGLNTLSYHITYAAFALPLSFIVLLLVIVAIADTAAHRRPCPARPSVSFRLMEA